MTRDEVIEKIKKLLRMKRGGTPAEVETALNLAREMAAKHGVDIGSVNPDDEQQRERLLGHEDGLLSARIQFECKYAALIAMRFFNVSVFIHRPTWNRFALNFVGEEWDRQVAIYVFKFLCGHFRREWKTRRGRCRNRHAFMYGMYVGLKRKLEEREKSETPDANALVRIERSLVRRNAYIAEHFGKMERTDTTPDGDAQKAMWAGYQAGRDTEIRGGVKDAHGRAAERLGTNQTGQLLLS